MAATLRDVFFRLGYELDKSSERKAENSINSLKAMAKKALGTIGVTLSIAGFTKGISSCVALSSDVEEMENKFNVVFGHIGDEVDAWAEEYSDAIRRNKNDIKTYLADQQNLLTGFGMTREAGAELSKQMTTLALDLASFGNINEADAVAAMTKAVMGESESAKRLGAVLTDTTRAEAMRALGISGTYDKLDQLTKMQVNYHAILSQSPDAVGDCERSMGSYQSTLRGFHAKLKEIKQLIGKFFMPAVQKVLSFGAKGLTQLRNWLDKLNAFAAKLGGSEKIIGTFGAALSAVLVVMSASKAAKIISFAKSILKVGGAFKMAAAKAAAFFGIFLLLALVVQDFVGFMKGDNSLIGSMFDKAGVGAENARKVIFGAWNGVKRVLLKVWDGIKTAAETIWGTLSEWWVENGEGVKEAFAGIWEVIKLFCTTIWEALSEAAIGIFGALKKFWDRWGENIIAFFDALWKTLISLIEPFLSAVSAIISFLANVFTGDWEGAWKSIKNFVASIWDGIVAIMEGAWRAVCAIWDGVKGFFCDIFQNVWDGVAEKVTNIKNSIVDGFQEAIDWIKSLPEKAVQWGADIINGIVEGIKGAVKWVGDAVGGVAKKIKGFLGFSVPQEGPLSDFQTYMPDMMDLMSKGIVEGKDKVKKALEAITGDMSVIAKTNIVSKNTLQGVSGSTTNNRSVNQHVEINNKFYGDLAGQKKSAEAMGRASDDATSQMARALAFAR